MLFLGQIVISGNHFFFFVNLLMSLTNMILLSIVLFGIEQFCSSDVVSGSTLLNGFAKIFVTI